MAITYLSGQRIQGLVEADGYIDFDGASSGEGTGDYAKAGSNSDFNFLHEDNDWSLAFWIYLNGTPQSGEPSTLATMGATTDTGICIHADTSSHLTFLQDTVSNDWTQKDFVTLSNTTWTHIAVTQNASTDTIKFYVDGVNDPSDDVDTSGHSWGSGNSTEELNFAVNPRTTYKVLNCKMSDVGLWDNHVLSQADITKLAGGTRITNDGTGFAYATGNLTNHWTFFTDYTDSKGSLNASSGGGDNTFGSTSAPTATDDKSTVTDVPVGSQFEETNTRKFYQRADASTYTQSDDSSSQGAYDDAVEVVGGKITTSASTAIKAVLGNSVTTCKLKLRKVGTPSGTITAGVWRTGSGGTIIHTFGTMEASALTTSFVEYTFTSASAYTFVADDIIGFKYYGTAQRVDSAIGATSLGSAGYPQLRYNEWDNPDAWATYTNSGGVYFILEKPASWVERGTAI